MDPASLELHIFVSLAVILGAALVALIVDYLKGNNEQLREHNIELRVRKEELEKRGPADPWQWFQQRMQPTPLQHRTATWLKNALPDTAERQAAPVSATRPVRVVREIRQEQAEPAPAAVAEAARTSVKARSEEQRTEVCLQEEMRAGQAPVVREIVQEAAPPRQDVTRSGQLLDRVIEVTAPERTPLAEPLPTRVRGGAEPAPANAAPAAPANAAPAPASAAPANAAPAPAMPAPAPVMAAPAPAMAAPANAAPANAVPVPASAAVEPRSAAERAEPAFTDAVAKPPSPGEARGPEIPEPVVLVECVEEPEPDAEAIVRPLVEETPVSSRPLIDAETTPFSFHVPVAAAGEAIADPFVYRPVEFDPSIAERLIDSGPSFAVKPAEVTGAEEESPAPEAPAAAPAPEAVKEPEQTGDTKPPTPASEPVIAQAPPEPPRSKPAEFGLPSRFLERSAAARLVEQDTLVNGLVIAVTIQDFDLIKENAGRAGLEELMRSVTSLMRSLTGDQDFGARTGEADFVIACRLSESTDPQRITNRISERLWDYQLRSLGGLSVMFRWGAVEARDLPLGEAIAAACERMHQTRRTRKTISMDAAGVRRRASA